MVQATMLNWVATFLSILYALFITPVIIRALNTDLYGVWSFLNGLLAYSSLFYVGLGAAFIKYLSHYRALNDRASVDRLASVVLLLYTTIGLLCLVLCIALAPIIPRLLAQPLQPAESRQTALACMLLGSRLLFMFIATVFSGILIAEERITTVTTVTIVAIIGRSVAVWLTLSHHAPLVTLAVIMSVSAGCEAVALAVAAARGILRVRIGLVRPRVTELRLLYGFGIKAFFMDLSAWLINYTDTVVIGVLIGAVGVAFYSIPLQLVTYGRVIVAGMVSALLPRLSAYEAAGDRTATASAYERVSRATSYVAAFIALNLLTLGVAFLRLWVGEQFAAVSFAIVACLAIAGFCQALSTQAAVPFFQAMHRLGTPVRFLLIEAALNLSLSIWLAHRLGVAGVALATLLPTLITTVVLPMKLCRELNIGIPAFIKVAVLPSIGLLILGVPLNLALDHFGPPASYGALVLRGIVNVCLAVVLAAAVLPTEDVAALRSLLKFRGTV